jgi:predicted DNA-binding transcriptional regulator YafY
MGLLAIRQYNFPVEVAAIEGALAKTERVMPEKLFYRARSLQETIVFNISTPEAVLQNDILTVLSAAIQQRRQVHLRYQAWSGDESERTFDPYGIVFNEGYWYTAGYCHLRQGLRTFRLDRVVSLNVEEQDFEWPNNFDVLGHVLHSVTMFPGTEQVEVLFETTMEHAQQVITPAMGALEPSDNGVIFRRVASQLEGIAHILLSLNFPVHVLKPKGLHDILREMAARALHMVDTSVL